MYGFIFDGVKEAFEVYKKRRQRGKKPYTGIWNIVKILDLSQHGYVEFRAHVQEFERSLLATSYWVYWKTDDGTKTRVGLEQLKIIK